VTASSPAAWELWAPPLNPPVEAGLPYDAAQAIADAWWDEDPHLCAALQWEAYAASLPPAPAVAQVSTGVQSVTYGRAIPGGELGMALTRAQWHRSFTTLVSVPLQSVVPTVAVPLPGWWEVEGTDP
jgi:hypothetical protein